MKVSELRAIMRKKKVTVAQVAYACGLYQNIVSLALLQHEQEVDTLPERIQAALKKLNIV